MKREETEQFVGLLTGAQNRLFAYILSLLGDANWAEDVLQETNLVLWKKADEYELGTTFDAWACKVAHFQVLAARRDAGREKMLFDDSLLESLASRAESKTAGWDQVRTALRTCTQKLTTAQQELLKRRYAENRSVAKIAEEDGQSPTAVGSALYRVRRTLMECIRRMLRQDSNS